MKPSIKWGWGGMGDDCFFFFYKMDTILKKTNKNQKKKKKKKKKKNTFSSPEPTESQYVLIYHMKLKVYQIC